MLSALLDRILNRGEVAEKAVDQSIALAAATLLIEVAWADHDIAEAELAVIKATLSDQFQLADDDIEAIISDSRDHHEDSVGLYRFTRTLVDAWEEPERFRLVVQLWRLAYSDAHLDRFEEHMIRKIAELLYVSHRRFIEAKQLARRSNADD